MDFVGLGLGVVGQARSLAQSIGMRIENVRHGREEFKHLSDRVADLTGNIDVVDGLKEKFPHALPQDVNRLFNGTFSFVRDRLRVADATVEKDFSTAFAGSSSSILDRLKSKGHRVFRANALKRKMSAVEAEVRDLSSRLLHLSTMLAITVKMETMNNFESMEENFVSKAEGIRYNALVYAPFRTIGGKGGEQFRWVHGEKGA